MELERNIGEQEARLAQVEQIYMDHLGLDWESLQGKAVIDLGAGDAAFGEVARRHGVDVTSVERRIDTETGEFSWLDKNKHIVADIQELPVADASFDLALSHAGPFMMTESKAEFTVYIHEALRVVRPGGMVRFGPGIPGMGLGPDQLLTENELATLSDDDQRRRMDDRLLEILRAEVPDLERVIPPGRESYDAYFTVRKPLVEEVA